MDDLDGPADDVLARLAPPRFADLLRDQRLDADVGARQPHAEQPAEAVGVGDDGVRGGLQGHFLDGGTPVGVDLAEGGEDLLEVPGRQQCGRAAADVDGPQPACPDDLRVVAELRTERVGVGVVQVLVGGDDGVEIAEPAFVAAERDVQIQVEFRDRVVGQVPRPYVVDVPGALLERPVGGAGRIRVLVRGYDALLDVLGELVVRAVHEDDSFAPCRSVDRAPRSEHATIC